MTDEVLPRAYRPLIREIQRAVCRVYELQPQDMTSANRKRIVARPRQIGMYLSSELASRSMLEIGRRFGGRDHTTVMYAVGRVRSLRETDADVAHGIEASCIALAEIVAQRNSEAA